jgi:ribosomal protein S6--L-glutamate ligase
MKAAFLTRRHEPQSRSIVPEVARLLRERDVEVDMLYPDEQVLDLACVPVAHDLYVLKEKTEMALTLAASFHDRGALLVNPLFVTEVCRDKVATSRVLQRARVPIPETFVGATPRHLAPLLETGALVVKPRRGSQGRGVRVVRDVAHLEEAPSEGSVFAQRYYEPDGKDRKIYRIGEAIFGVERVWPARTYEEKIGEPFEVTGRLRDITLRCGAAFGIDLYGLDIIVTAQGPFVVDFSSFPGFKGVPQADVHVADYLIRALERRGNGKRESSPVRRWETREAAR